jgi:hypothetical protein
VGAFILFDKNSGHNYKDVEAWFTLQGFALPERFEIGDYWLWLYKKLLVEEDNYYIEGENAVFAAGTFIYGAGTYTEGLRSLFNDLKNGNFNEDELKGNYFILFKKGESLYAYTDRTGIYNLYYDSSCTVLSSSLLACVYDSFLKFTLERKAVLEVLTTGSLIGPDTLFKGISRVEKNAMPDFPGINFTAYYEKADVELCKKDYNECIDVQINELEKYFGSIKTFADLYGADSGITGGHDSRLIMALALKHFKNISFHSHWRKTKDKELSSAEAVCRAADVPLRQVEVKPPADMSEDEMAETLERGFIFTDGHIRMHSFWIEQYNTRAYREQVLGGKRLGLSGIGGEQYRNEERFIFYVKDMKHWIKYELLLNEAGNAFRNETVLNELTDSIESKVRNRLSYKGNKYISHLIFKRYFNEVYLPARLGARNNAENRLSFFLSPFTDYRVSHRAYEAVNKLGPAYQFEEDMIKKLNPVIAAVPSDHGFDFNTGEPFSNKLKSYMKELIPDAIYVNRTEKYWKRKGNESYKRLNEKFKIIRECVERVKALDLPLDIENLSYKPDLMPSVISMGYFLKRLEDKIR